MWEVDLSNLIYNSCTIQLQQKTVLFYIYINAHTLSLISTDKKKDILVNQ